MNKQQQTKEQEANRRALEALASAGMEQTEVYKDLLQKSQVFEDKNFDPDELKAMKQQKEKKLNNNETVYKDGKGTA